MDALETLGHCWKLDKFKNEFHTKTGIAAQWPKEYSNKVEAVLEFMLVKHKCLANPEDEKTLSAAVGLAARNNGYITKRIINLLPVSVDCRLALFLYLCTDQNQKLVPDWGGLSLLRGKFKENVRSAIGPLVSACIRGWSASEMNAFFENHPKLTKAQYHWEFGRVTHSE